MCFGNAQHENRIFMVCENFLLVKRNQTIYDGIRLDSSFSVANVFIQMLKINNAKAFNFMKTVKVGNTSPNLATRYFHFESK